MFGQAGRIEGHGGHGTEHLVAAGKLSLQCVANDLSRLHYRFVVPLIELVKTFWVKGLKKRDRSWDGQKWRGVVRSDPVKFCEKARTRGTVLVRSVADHIGSNLCLPLGLDEQEARAFWAAEPFVVIRCVVVWGECCQVQWNHSWRVSPIDEYSYVLSHAPTK